jgi:MFS family permease
MPQHLMPLWTLSAAEAGLMASGFSFGYMVAVPVLTALTALVDARNILLVGSFALSLATLAFGLLANGLWTATIISALGGIGFAGAYMPGLKALTDRLSPGDASRSITLYTGSFSVGVGLSFAKLLRIGSAGDGRLSPAGLGPVLMIAVCLAMGTVTPAPAQWKLLDFRPVIRNRTAIGYVLGYGAHCFELYGIRTWLVASWSLTMNGVTPFSRAQPAARRGPPMLQNLRRLRRLENAPAPPLARERGKVQAPPGSRLRVG